MTELKVELSQKIQQGKQALSESEFDRAIFAFESAVEIAKELSPSLQSIIGISYAYMALAYGKKNIQDKALENITTATELIPSDTKEPMAYASILLGLGVDFLKMELFNCSTITLKKALKLARNQVTDQDLESISIIARNLALSYKKVNNRKPAAKLFRIAGDLEDKPNVSIDLYRNSAYLYYQEKMKEEALNILETAFDKAGILGDIQCQTEIARFQATISYEIFLHYHQNSHFDQAIAYADLCFEKFTFIQDQFWIVKILFEKAMLLEKIGDKSQRNKILKQISQFKHSEEIEEFLIKSHLLMTIQALEAEKIYDASFYIEKISDHQLKQLESANPQLKHKIIEVKEILYQSQQRGKLYSNLRFSRKDLDLPVEALISESEVIPFKSISESEDLSSLSPPTLEVTVPTDPNVSSKLKPPSVEALQKLFEVEKEKPQVIQEPMITPVTPKIEFTTKHREEKDEKVDYSRLFKAHKISPEEVTSASTATKLPVEVPTNIIPDIRDVPRIIYTEEIQQIDIRSEVARRLQKAGWSLRLNFSNITQRGAEPDIVAEKGLIRKNRKLIFFAENPADAEICSFLLQSNLESGEKIIFLINGSPKDVSVTLNIKVLTQIDQLFK
ncbi:MAG: tetratricopeptide repeat protein [Candidatus Hodarchaeota archaeon]